MELRPLSYDELCQMELLQLSGSAHSNAATVLPIVMIPTSVVSPGTAILTTAAATSQSSTDNGVAGNEQVYQFQPTHVFASTATTSDPVAQHQEHASGSLQSQTLFLPTIEQHQRQQQQQQQQQQHNTHLQQLPQAQQQIPQTQLQQQLPATLNIIYTGTLTAAPRSQNALDSATLPRDFAPAVVDINACASSTVGDESDFDGSECGASVSGATCIPHFRFGGCGMMLQPSVTTGNTGGHHEYQHHHQHYHQQQQQQQHHHPHRRQQPEAVGCAAFSQMMGTFASAAGGAMHSARFAGTLGSLSGVSAGLSSTLGRNRRTSSYRTGATQQTPKRVSFKGDNLPPGGMKELQEIHSHCDNGDAGGTDALSNCSYMHFNNFMDNQATGFGGLPDVTEHSNAHRTLSRQNSISNSDSGGEIASIEKSKVNFGDGRPLPTAHPANIKRKSKATHQAASDSCARVHRLKPRRGSCTIFLTLVAALCLFTIAAMLAYQHFVAPSRNSHAQRLKIVQRILKEVPLVDGHNNFAWNVRKYAHNSLELVHMRRDPSAEALWTRPSWAQTDIERLKQGLVGVQMWSAYVPCEALGLDAVQVAIEQIDIIRRLTDMFTGDTILVSSSKDIFTARQHGQMASLIGIKGGHAIGSSLAVLRSFYSVGARSLSLTHKCDLSWAGSSASESESGLSAFGKAVIREMNRLGMMVDLSHSSDATARDVLQVTRAPVIFSHSAARQLCNSTRNVPDDILRLVADNGGLIMVSFDPEDVACGQQAYLGDVVEHIKHIRAIAGVQHIGLGAGYDGIEVPPVGLEDVSKYPDLLATLLQDHNWSEQDIAMLAGKNFLRILETVENVRDYWKRADIQPLEQTEPQPKPQCTYMSS
ncbi:PREDICTED: uncharacterized protein LOC108368885 isoform X3 [Rhagoletis zephyria]|uniref:uncharacterized protein LOC108368885 isoform X3 n=1 Tax=Rhagoletis zephyria TaxID=28612 RepID=UPI00081123BD|nr:PREDICTED: uncharacterized protein LOC108368885 isoform X3 [Rhagoletis zephyria]